MTEPAHTNSSFDPNSLRPELLESVRVTKTNEERVVDCYCGDRLNRSIVPHFKKCHSDQWDTWVRLFVDLRRQGVSLKKIMRLFRSGNGPLLFSWTVIDRAIRSSVERGDNQYTPPPINSVTSWEPNEFELAATTIWDFPNRGNWAVHSGDYRGNWPPQLVRNLILKYTKPGDLVLDTFMGGGTTLIEAWLLDRCSIGIDVSKLAHQTTSARLNHMQLLSQLDNRVTLKPQYRPKLHVGDSTFKEIDTPYKVIRHGTVNLLCMHPPYLNALPYTDEHPADLSRIKDPDEFLARIAGFAERIIPYLAANSTCALLIGDVRRDGRIIPLGAWILETISKIGFRLEDIIVKTQHRDRSNEFYFSSSQEHLLAHEYLYIFKWPMQEEG